VALLDFDPDVEIKARSTARRLTSNASWPRGELLHSLASTELGAHFYSWLGVSGRRFVCSVYRRGQESFLLELPQSIIIGVARDGEIRVPRILLCMRAATGDSDRELFEEAAALGIDEWHVHFDSSEAAFGELAGLLLAPIGA
jgi:hypothetical protein